MSANTMQKALMRDGDFHLRGDARHMFGNYVELSPTGGAGVLANVRRSTMVVSTPVFDEPKLWQIEVQFAGISTPSLMTPWLPAMGAAYELDVKVHSSLDRDKAVALELQTLTPLDFLPQNGGTSRFTTRFLSGVQVGVSVAIRGETSPVIAVQASIVEVGTGARDAFGNAVITHFDQADTSAVFLQPNAKRRQFIVQNWGSTPLYVAFAPVAAGPLGGTGAWWTLALPNRGDVYESPRDCWQGHVSGVWEVDAPAITDAAVVTEST